MPLFTGSRLGFGKDAAGGGVVDPMTVDKLPPAYQTLLTDTINAGYTMVYVDKETGDDSNNGTSMQTPKQNYFNLFSSSTAGVTAGTCIVVRGFHFKDWNTGSNAAVIGNGSEYMRVLAYPGQTLLRARNSGGGRDHHIGDAKTTSTHVYGAILEKVRDTARTTNYMTAFHSAGSKGRYYNCVFRSVNTNSPDDGTRDQSNDLFTMHYDNSNLIDTDVYNSTMLGTWNASNYSGTSSACDLYDCNGNDSSTASAGSTSGSVFGVTINADFSASNNAKGVYGGTYAWDALKFNSRFSYGNPYE